MFTAVTLLLMTATITSAGQLVPQWAQIASVAKSTRYLAIAGFKCLDKVYVNGVAQAGLVNFDDPVNFNLIQLPLGSSRLAVKVSRDCQGGFASSTRLKAFDTFGLLASNSSWKCASAQPASNWYSASFDYSSWPNAVQLKSWGLGQKILSAVLGYLHVPYSQAYWISTSESSQQPLYCLFQVPSSLPSSGTTTAAATTTTTTEMPIDL